MKRALIIFVKNRVPGTVKTRLASTVGDNRAMEVYTELLEITAQEAGETDADRFLYYSNEIPDQDDIWDDQQFVKRVQQGDGLGERMFNAFDECFKDGYDQVQIIGSDCPEISASIIQKGFDTLNEVDVVIGPATDGGYYLLGMNYLIDELFQEKTWSSESVFDDTIADLIDQNIIWHELPMLSDIDTEEDLRMLDIKRLLKKATRTGESIPK